MRGHPIGAATFIVFGVKSVSALIFTPVYTIHFGQMIEKRVGM